MDGESEVILHSCNIFMKKKNTITENLHITAVDVNPNHWMNLATNVALDQPI